MAQQLDTSTDTKEGSVVCQENVTVVEGMFISHPQKLYLQP